MIFLHSLQDHIKVIILMLANHAETVSSAYNKNAKWESFNRIKINSNLNFTKSFSLCKPMPQRGVKYYWPHTHKIFWPNSNQTFLQPFQQTCGRQNQIQTSIQCCIDVSPTIFLQSGSSIFLAWFRGHPCTLWSMTPCLCPPCHAMPLHMDTTLCTWVPSLL